MKIKTIYFRCQNETRDIDGQPKILFGEDFYNLGGMVDMGFFITEISVGNVSHGNTPFAQIFVNDKLWCEIHESSITRVYYDMTV